MYGFKVLFEFPSGLSTLTHDLFLFANILVYICHSPAISLFFGGFDYVPKISMAVTVTLETILVTFVRVAFIRQVNYLLS